MVEEKIKIDKKFLNKVLKQLDDNTKVIKKLIVDMDKVQTVITNEILNRPDMSALPTESQLRNLTENLKMIDGFLEKINKHLEK